ncbi:MAG TPA: ABC transporter ATP-binding protein, partial [Pirellulaceae bacterium]
QKDDLKANRFAVRLSRTVDLLLAISTALVLWLGGRMVLRGDLTPGLLLVFLVYLKRSFKPSQDFAKYTARLAKATAAGERVIELLQRAPDVGEPSIRAAFADPTSGGDIAGIPIADRGREFAMSPRAPGRIQFAKVDFSYDPGHPVLRDINLTIPPGLVTAIVGPSGAGKSTLLHLILRLFDPDRGSILLDGRDLRECSIAAIRGQFALVPQDCLLFAGTIRENIALGMTDVSEEEIREAARTANALEFIKRQPLGFDTPVGERGITLSRGQRQRLAVARAGLRRNSILLLDEPTTGLDESNKQAVIDGLLRVAERRTAIMVTHEAALADRADQVISLEHGRIVDVSPPECRLHHEITAPSAVVVSRTRTLWSVPPT